MDRGVVFSSLCPSLSCKQAFSRLLQIWFKYSFDFGGWRSKGKLLFLVNASTWRDVVIKALCTWPLRLRQPRCGSRTEWRTNCSSSSFCLYVESALHSPCLDSLHVFVQPYPILPLHEIISINDCDLHVLSQYGWKVMQAWINTWLMLSLCNGAWIILGPNDLAGCRQLTELDKLPSKSSSFISPVIFRSNSTNTRV